MRRFFALVIWLIACDVFAVQGGPVYVDVAPKITEGAACSTVASSGRVRVESDTGKMWCCVDSAWTACGSAGGGNLLTLSTLDPNVSMDGTGSGPGPRLQLDVPSSSSVVAGDSNGLWLETEGNHIQLWPKGFEHQIEIGVSSGSQPGDHTPFALGEGFELHFHLPPDDGSDFIGGMITSKYRGLGGSSNWPGGVLSFGASNSETLRLVSAFPGDPEQVSLLFGPFDDSPIDTDGTARIIRDQNGVTIGVDDITRNLLPYASRIDLSATDIYANGTFHTGDLGSTSSTIVNRTGQPDATMNAAAIGLTPHIGAYANDPGGVDFVLYNGDSTGMGGGTVGNTFGDIWIAPGEFDFQFATNDNDGAGPRSMPSFRMNYPGLVMAPPPWPGATREDYVSLGTEGGVSLVLYYESTPRLVLRSAGVSVVGSSLRFEDSASATPSCGTCDSSTRGTFCYVGGTTGVKDIAQVCAKDAADAYAWRTLY